MLNRKGQLFTVLMAIMTLIVLGTALFFLSQKADKFGGMVGTQSHAAVKMYLNQEKIFNVMQLDAKDDLHKSVNDALANSDDRGCGKLGAKSYWLTKDKRCIPDFRTEIEKEFNKRFPERFDPLFKKPKLLSFNSPRSRLDSSESFRFNTGVWRPPLNYYITPLKDGEVALIASAPIGFEMEDAEEGYRTIASIQQYPSYRVSPTIDFYKLLKVQSLPDLLVKECKAKEDDKLKSCIGAVFKQLVGEKAITRGASSVKGREAEIGVSLTTEGTIDVSFAVSIPVEGLFAVGPISVEQKGDPLTAQAFAIEAKDPLSIKTTVSTPSTDDLIIRLCTKETDDQSKATCAGNVIFSNNGAQQGAEKTTVSQNKKAVEVVYEWNKFPQKDFEFWIEAQRGQDSVSSKNRVKVFNRLP